MEKSKTLIPVLFITRSFPPSPLTAASRAQSFAGNLHRFGYYPIVITRNWEVDFKNFDNTHQPSGNELLHVVNDHYEVFYVPFRGRFAERPLAGKSRILKKLAALGDIYLGWHHRFDPHFDLALFANEQLKKNKAIQHVLITLPPFPLLSFAPFLKKRHPVKIVVDYRDEWNTAGNVIEESGKINFLSKAILNYFNGPKARLKREAEALSRVDAIVTISEDAKKNLGAIFQNKIAVLPNGFIASELEACQSVNMDPQLMQISYAGWLYKTQQVEVILDAIKLLADKHGKGLRLKLVFIGGLSFPGMKERLMGNMKGYEQFIELTPRVDKATSLRMQRQSALLLLVAHKGLGTIPSSKLYEYIALQRQVLLVPSDNGIMLKTLEENQVGIWRNDAAAAAEAIDTLYTEFLNKNHSNFEVSGSRRSSYERGQLVSVLADTFNALSKAG